MWDKVKALWIHHGTKLIGFGSTALGALSMLDATTINYLSSTFGDHRGHQITAGLMLISGLGTAYRGYKNSQPPK